MQDIKNKDKDSTKSMDEFYNLPPPRKKSPSRISKNQKEKDILTNQSTTNKKTKGLYVSIDDNNDATSHIEKISCFTRLSTSFYTCWLSFGPDADPWLLIISCIISAIGAFIASPNPIAGQGLDILLIGFSLIWSVGAPVADILSASLYSVYVSKRGGKQGSAMGFITSAGSAGRITFPLVCKIYICICIYNVIFCSCP